MPLRRFADGERHAAAIARRAERVEDERRLRDLCDPHFERDFERGQARERLHAPNIKVACPRAIPPPPPIADYPYPEHSPRLPNTTKLHRLAEYSCEDRVVLDQHHAPLAVRIERVELGDVALPPKPLTKTHEGAPSP